MEGAKCRLQAAGYAAGCRWRVVGCRLWIAGCSCKLWVVDYNL